MNIDWKSDPSLQNMDPVKLEMLQALAEQGKHKNLQEMLPFLMTAAASGQKQGLKFSPEERQLILNVLKKDKSPQETARMERIISLLGMIR